MVTLADTAGEVARIKILRLKSIGERGGGGWGQSLQMSRANGRVETHRMVMAEIRIKSHARNVQLNLIM